MNPLSPIRQFAASDIRPVSWPKGATTLSGAPAIPLSELQVVSPGTLTQSLGGTQPTQTSFANYLKLSVKRLGIKVRLRGERQRTPRWSKCFTASSHDLYGRSECLLPNHGRSPQQITRVLSGAHAHAGLTMSFRLFKFLHKGVEILDLTRNRGNWGNDVDRLAFVVPKVRAPVPDWDGCTILS
jgi:hypothetical protein